MVQTLENPAAWRALAQSNEGVCYAHKIDKTEAQIDWRQSAAHIARKVRAFDPFPGASARLGGEMLKIWGAQVVAPSEMASIANETLALGAAKAVNQSEVVLISAGVAHTNIGADPSIRPGQILASGPHGLRVAAGHGSCLCITHLQRPGGKRLAVADFLQGHPVAPGLCFDGPAALRTA